MASNIDSTNIDATYPVAGQDNDSQGFRDNFNTIKNSLATAKSEITDLQTNTAKLNENNDFNGNNIQEANFIATTDEVYGIGNVSASQNVNWTNGNYQTVQVGGDVTFTLSEWPESGKLGKIRMVVTSDGIARTVTFSAGGGGTIRYDSDYPSPLQPSSTTQAKIVDLWTSNGGLVVYAHFVGTFG